MKHSPLTIVAVVFLGLLTLFTAVTWWQFSREQSRLTAANAQLNRIRYEQFLVNSLANEAGEYANNNHPLIIPILEARGYHMNKTAAATNKQGSK